MSNWILIRGGCIEKGGSSLLLVVDVLGKDLLFAMIEVGNIAERACLSAAMLQLLLNRDLACFDV